MAESRKSYRSPLLEGKNDPYPFDIEGEPFTAYPGRVPSAVMLDISRVIINGDSNAMWEFFQMALTPPYDKLADPPEKADLTQYNRFHQFLRDPDREIRIEELGELIGDIQAEADKRRPKAQSSS